METLTVGVTGHRPPRLGEIALGDLATRVREAMVTVKNACGDRPIRLISNLAEGADSIAFDEAANLGWPIDVVLPFEPGRNAREFPDASARARLNDRLASSRFVFALSTDGHGNDEPPEFAFERAGRVMLAQSDMLLAIWDGAPAKGRGGAAQIIEEAVSAGIPVIHIDLASDKAIKLLWSRLDNHHFGQAELSTVASGGLDQLPALIAHLVEGEDSGRLPAANRQRRPTMAIAYAMLLQLAGVRKVQRSDLWQVRVDSNDVAAAMLTAPRASSQIASNDFSSRLTDIVAARFAIADAVASEAGRRFRSAYVGNFVLAALAVLISLSGLVLPAAGKPVLVCLELATIAGILVITRFGNRSGWHRRWLDARRVAEELRCLAISSQLGDLRLRADLHPASRAAARELGLPDVVADKNYLGSIHADLLRLIDKQIEYLSVDASRMHQLEHRLHRLGGALFGLTAAICLILLVAELAAGASVAVHVMVEPFAIWGTVFGAALPAIGAAIYGIRMQGDFAGIAERDRGLADQLRRVRLLCDEANISYDALRFRTGQVAELLTQDLSSWLQTYAARPLALPG